jgi:hypothetical protein
MLVVRNMMTTDFPFLLERQEWMSVYVKDEPVTASNGRIHRRAHSRANGKPVPAGLRLGD